MTVADVVGEGIPEQVFHLITEHLGDSAHVRFAATQITWARRRGFAFLWSPKRWQGPSAAPVVLTLALTGPDPSARWKEVYQVRPGLWNHHLEIHDLAAVDAEVMAWLDMAWEQAA